MDEQIEAKHDIESWVIIFYLGGIVGWICASMVTGTPVAAAVIWPVMPFLYNFMR